MGLGPILSLYQARFNRYLQARGLVKWEREPRVYAFIGDGETDEPETLGQVRWPRDENLDNLCWVVNCNLQRLDGPVRGNGKIIQELEGVFRGAAGNVIKVIWGSDWTTAGQDTHGLLVKRMEERSMASIRNTSSSRAATFADTFLSAIFTNPNWLDGEIALRRCFGETAAARPMYF